MKPYKCVFLCLQFPVPAQHQKSSDNLGISYVTERILASVLPRRSAAHKHHDPHNRPHTIASEPPQPPQDIYEKELILMLEQKHGKVRYMPILPLNSRFRGVDIYMRFS